MSSATTTTRPPGEEAAGGSRHPGLALVVIAAAQLMVVLDMTIVNIALPAMQRELHFSQTNLAWVINAYALTFGGLLLLGGRTGDLFGRRRMFVAGIAVFTVASLAGGFATNQAWLVAARALQGAGAAVASPTALSLIASTFPDGRQRHRAMAVYAGMSAAGGALGLLLGGILVDVASWRWVLFVNVPIGAAVALAAPSLLARVPGHGGTLDLPGAVSGSAGMAALVYGLLRAPEAGWTDSSTLIAFAVGALLLATFVAVEARRNDALLPLRFLSDRSRSSGYIVMLLLGASMLSLIYFLTQFLQNVLAYSPIMAGVAYLPIPFTIGSTGLVVSRLVHRFGTRTFLTAGPLFVAGGLLWASTVHQGSSYPSILGPLVIIGIGMGLSFVPLTLNAVSGVEPKQTGLASALLNTSQQVGGSLGLAVLVTVAATVARSTLAAGHATAATAMGAAARHAASLHAEVAGTQAALRVGALGALLGFVIALAGVRAKGATAGARGGAGDPRATEHGQADGAVLTPVLPH